MTDNNPYEAPSAELSQAGPPGFALVDPRKVPAAHGWGWIAAGFEYFKRAPVSWILAIAVYLIISVVLMLIPLYGQFALSMTNFVWTGGIMLGCRAQAEGRQFKVAHLFAGFTNHAGKLLFLSALIAIASLMLMVAVFGSLYIDLLSTGGDPGAEVLEGISDPTGLLLRLLFGALLIVPIMMAAWFAPALIVINDLAVMDALRLSFIGCIRNVVPFLIYGLGTLALVLLAAIPPFFGYAILFVGYLVVMPILFASMFAGYRDIFVKQAGGAA